MFLDYIFMVFEHNIGTSREYVPFEESIYYQLLSSIRTKDGRKPSPEAIHTHFSRSPSKANADLFHFNERDLERILSQYENNYFIQALREWNLPEYTDEVLGMPKYVDDIENFYSFELPRRRNWLFKLYPTPEEVKEGILKGYLSKDHQIDEELLGIKIGLESDRVISDLTFGGLVFTAFGFSSVNFTSAVLTTLISVAAFDYFSTFDKANKVLAEKSGAYLPSKGHLLYPAKRAREAYLNPATNLQNIYISQK